MKRRSFLAGAAAAAGASALPGPAIAQGRAEWRLVMPWPKNTPGVAVNAQRFADRVGAASGGRLAIKVFGAGELVPPFESLDAVMRGVADIGHGTPYYWANKSKALHFFTTVPFGLTATELAAWIYFGDGQALWDEVYAQFGLKGFYAGNSGVQAGGWFRKEIKTLSDLKGLKFRIAGLGGEVMRRLGVTTVLTPPGEIGPAMASGAIDAAEWVGPWNDLAFGLYRTAKFYYLPAFHEPGPALEVFVNRARFEALAPDLQEIVKAVASATANETLADFQRHNIESLDPLLTQHGVELRQFADEIVAALGKTTLEVLNEFATGDALTARVHASYMAFLRKANRYNTVFDRKMLEMRAKVLG
ncbi:MAG: TRAP transporter substrate-binding protein [Proteobacteria bacterium]|nr:TRAP transporter substrate-binding protein [Pseudomonadota bacterium]